jgi:serine/threonine protein kinase
MHYAHRHAHSHRVSAALIASAIRRFCGRDVVGWDLRSSVAVAFLCRHGLHHHHPNFNYQQLRVATTGFDAAGKLLDGGFKTVFLAHLHFGVKPSVVHRDVTTSNIFVEVDMRVCLDDFGLSWLLAPLDACATGGVRGLMCCNFGMVVLELVTGFRPVDVGRERRDMTLVDWVVAKI